MPKKDLKVVGWSGKDTGFSIAVTSVQERSHC